MHTRAFFIGLVIAVGSFLPANAQDFCGTTAAMANLSPEQREEILRNSVTSLVPANELLLYLHFGPATIRPGNADSTGFRSPLVNANRNVPAPTMTAQQISQAIDLVKDDFAPFNIRITTNYNEFLSYPIANKHLNIITTLPSVLGMSSDTGGVAPWAGIGTRLFSNPSFTFAQVWGNNPIAVADTISHEVGHTLGLAHQVHFTANCGFIFEYHPTIGTGPLGFGQIMGFGLQDNLYQGISNWWSQECPHPQYGGPLHDFELLSDQVVLLPDDFPNSASLASPEGTTTLPVTGILGESGDVDFIRVDLTTGTTLAATSGNIDIEASVFETDGTPIATFNDPLSPSVNFLVPSGPKDIRIRAASNANMDAQFMTGQYTLTDLGQTCASLPPDIDGWWKSDGNANDILGINNGTPIGSPLFIKGQVGQAVRFDPSNGTDGVQLPSPGIFKGQSGGTIEAWVRTVGPHSNENGYGGQVFLENTSTLSFTRFGLNVLNDGTVLARGRASEAGDPTELFSTQTIPLDTWSHIAATWDAVDGLRLYINGSQTGSLAGPVGTFTNSDSTFMSIGVGGLPSILVNAFNGDIDETTVYTRALSASEIQAIFNAGSVGKCGGSEPLTITPQNLTVAVTQTQQFLTSGGIGSKTFSIIQNNSGGAIDSITGLYTAGTAGGTDTFRVTDGFMNSADAVVNVTNNISCPGSQKVWDGGGTTNNWSEAANWCNDTVPISDDAVIFNGTSTKDATIDSLTTIASLTTNAGYSGTITQSGGLTVGTSGFTHNSGAFIGGGMLQLRGNLTVGASATFNAGSGTLVFDGPGNQGLVTSGTLTFNNLTVNKPTGTVLFFASQATNLIIAGTLTLTDGGLQDNTGVSTFNAQGPVLFAPTFDGGNGPLLISGDSIRTVTLPVGAGIPRTTVNAANVTLDTSGAGTITFAQAFAVTNCASFTNGPVNFVFTQAFTYTAGTNFTLGSGDVSFGSTYTQTGGTFSPGTGALSFSDNVTVNGGTFNAPNGILQLRTNLTVGASATFNAGSGTLVFDGTGNQGLVTSGTLTFNNLTVNKPTGSVLFFAGGATNLIIAGTLTLTDGGLQDNTFLSTFNAQGPVSIASTFDGGGGPLLISGDAARTITLPAGAGIPRTTVNAANVTLDTSGAGTITFAQAFAVTNCASFTNGPVNFVFTQAFTYTAGTNFTLGSGDVSFGSTYTQTGGTFSPGTGALSFSDNVTVNGGTFNAPNGILQLRTNLTVGASATFNAGSGTLVFDGTGNQGLVTSGTLTFNNLTVNKPTGSVLFFAGGATNLIIAGTLTLTDGGLQDNTSLSTFNAQGPVSIASTFDGGIAGLTFSGSANQTYTNAGGVNPRGIWTVNKPSGTLTAASDLLLETTQALNITSGTLYLTDSSDLTVGPITVGPAGRLINDSSTTITLGGNVANAGNIFLLGPGAACPQADTVLIRSSVAGTQRNWSGVGNFAIADADIRDMAGTAPIIAYSSTDSGNNGTNWTFDSGCPPAVFISPQVLSIYRNQNQTFTTGGGFGNKTFSIPVNNSGGTINPTTGLYTPGNTINVADTVRVTDAFGQFADAQVSVIPGPPTKLAMSVQPPSVVQAGIQMSQIRVALQDNDGNTIPNATNAVTISLAGNPGNSTLSGTLTRNAENGIAIFNDISLNRPGVGYSFAFSSGSLVGTNSADFNVVPGPPTALGFLVQPSDTEALTVIAPPISVAIMDAAGNTVTSATNQVTITIGNNPSGGLLIGTTVRNAVGGVATFNNLQINNAGDGYTLQASAAGFTGATSASFNLLSPFVVRNTNDAGPGSFRNAITKSNQTTGAQTISFNLPGAGPHRIEPITAFPAVSDPLTIDATTQPGFSGTPIIELTGNNRVGVPVGLDLRSGNNTIKGLSINRFYGAAIVISSAMTGGNTIQANYIGTNTAGDTALPNGTGIVIGTPNNLIGGSTASERNLISGNQGSGIQIGLVPNAGAATGNVVVGNLIGTDAAGTAPLPNNSGIIIVSSQTTIGGLSAGQANLIAFNSQQGVRVSDGSSNRIRGNVVHSNSGLGIDLFPIGSTLNDPGDPDSGPNFLKNYPVLDFVTGGGGTSIEGTLNSSPAFVHTIDFYSSPECDPSGYGEGRTYIGSTNVTTNASNLAAFDVSFPTNTPIGHFVTATSTDSQGNTSEFSQCRVVTPSKVSISGTATNGVGTALEKVTIKLSGGAKTETLTRKNGSYVLDRIASTGNYTVRPSLTNYDFSPPSRNYSNIPSNQTDQNFVGTKTRSSITGNLIGLAGLIPLSLNGVTVTLSGTASRSTTANGSYAFHDLPPGPYTVTAIKDGWTFSPLSIDVNLTLADASLTHVAAQTSALEGRIFHSNATANPTGASGGNLGVMNANGTAFIPQLTRWFTYTSADASPDGSKIAYAIGPQDPRQLFYANSDGTGETLVDSGNYILYPKWSPDGTRIAYLYFPASGEPRKIRVRSIVNGAIVDISTGLSQTSSVGWLSSERIVFSANDESDSEIYAVNTDGSGLLKLTDNTTDDRLPTTSYDGSRIAYISSQGGGLQNQLSTMNADGSNKIVLRNDVASQNAAWSPDGTMLAANRFIAGTGFRGVAIDAATGSQVAVIHNEFLSTPDWAPDLDIATQTGANVPVEAGGVDITFSGVSTAGTTTVTQIPPSSAGTAPNGFVLGGLAYEITTTAAYTAPVTICFNVPMSIASTQTAFNALNLMHNEGGLLINRTTSRDFPTRTICGSVTTLSPFVIAEQIDPVLPSITGYVEDSNGEPMAEVSIQLTGAENRSTQTDINGFFTFVNLIEGESYTVQPKSLGYLFNEYSSDFIAVTAENSVVFTGTQSNFDISGRVTDNNGNGIAGVEVGLEGSVTSTTVTDVSGLFVFTSLPADGSYSVSPFQPGYVFLPPSQSIDALTGNMSGLDFTQFGPTAAAVSLSGRVLTVDGRGINNARVVVTDAFGNMLTARSNSFGYYMVNGLEASRAYTVSAAQKGYQFTDQFIVPNDNVTGFDLIASQDKLRSP